MTTSVRTRMTSCASPVVWSPTSNAPDRNKK
jgi:hypothetical protein